MTETEQPFGSNTQNADIEAVLRPMVTCSICLSLFVDPVALLDCLHTICGSCAVDWLDKSETCPHCRELVRGARDNFHVGSIVELYKSVAPNSKLCQERTPEDISLLGEKYCPGQLATRQGFIGRRYDTSDSSSDDDDESMADGSRSPQFPLAESARSRVTFMNVDVVGRLDCPSCDPDNTTGYVCPQPCPPFVECTIPAGHTVCAKCAGLLPVRQDVSKCSVCTRTTCDAMGQPCPPTWNLPIAIAPLKDTEFDPNWTFPLTHAFGENDYESMVFRNHCASIGMNLQQLFQQVLEFRGEAGLPRAAWQGPGSPPHDARFVGPNDQTCKHCALDLLEASLLDWWISKRESANLPEDVRTRSNCWYGIACRSPRHNFRHARSFNHICHPIRGADDPQADPPESGHRADAVSTLVLNQFFPPYSPSEVIFRDKGNQTMFLCSLSVPRPAEEAWLIPGKLTMWQNGIKAYYGLDGREYESQSTVHILKDMRNMRWVSSSGGVIPAGCRPVLGGHKTIDESRELLFHCSVWWCGLRVPGYTSPRLGCAVITFAGKEWRFQDGYELLCWN